MIMCGLKRTFFGILSEKMKSESSVRVSWMGFWVKSDSFNRFSLKGEK